MMAYLKYALCMSFNFLKEGFSANIPIAIQKPAKMNEAEIKESNRVRLF